MPQVEVQRRRPWIRAFVFAAFMLSAAACAHAPRRDDEALRTRAVTALRQWIAENPQSAVNLGDYDLEAGVVEPVTGADCEGRPRELTLVRFPRFDGSGWAFASFAPDAATRDAAGFALGDAAQVKALAIDPVCD